MAVLGTIRLSATAPWSQRRRVVGMVKSPVEGSTAVLIRLDTPVTFSDFIRPICLPDDGKRSGPIRRMDTFADVEGDGGFQPMIPPLIEARAEKFESISQLLHPKRVQKINENKQYFISPQDEDETTENIEHFEKYYANELTNDEADMMPKAEPLTITDDLDMDKIDRPRPDKAVTIQKELVQWTNCNTLGWSRQTDQLQRVQLKIGDMGACENISIATVNSICTEAVFHKMDCSEEEFAGSSVMCMLPDTRRWALVGVASWRIACAPTGVERPRMYDKISSNTEWIRSVITAEF